MSRSNKIALKDYVTKGINYVADAISYVAEGLGYVAEGISYVAEGLGYVTQRISYVAEGLDYVAERISYVAETFRREVKSPHFCHQKVRHRAHNTYYPLFFNLKIE